VEAARKQRERRELDDRHHHTTKTTHLCRRLRLLALQGAHHRCEQGRRRRLQPLGRDHLEHGLQDREHLKRLGLPRPAVARLQLGDDAVCGVAGVYWCCCGVVHGVCVVLCVCGSRTSRAARGFRWVSWEEEAAQFCLKGSVCVCVLLRARAGHSSGFDLEVLVLAALCSVWIASIEGGGGAASCLGRRHRRSVVGPTPSGGGGGAAGRRRGRGSARAREKPALSLRRTHSPTRRHID
jgi:hypothetical protein